MRKELYALFLAPIIKKSPIIMNSAQNSFLFLNYGNMLLFVSSINRKLYKEVRTIRSITFK